MEWICLILVYQCAIKIEYIDSKNYKIDKLDPIIENKYNNKYEEK